MSKEKRLEVRISDVELEKLKYISARAKLTKSQVIRLLINGCVISEPPPLDYYRLLTAVNRIGTNINQIAKTANETKVIDNIAYRENWELLQELMRKISEAVEQNQKFNVDEILIDGYGTTATFQDDDFVPDNF